MSRYTGLSAALRHWKDVFRQSLSSRRRHRGTASLVSVMLCPATSCSLRVLRSMSRAMSRAMSRSTAPTSGSLKSAEELPGPSLLTSLYWLLVRGYADRTHLLQLVQKRLYGPIWRSRFGPFDLVNVASPDMIAQVLRQEGRFPVRAELPHWKEYRDLRGQAYGLHVDTDVKWQQLRRALNPRMLKLQEVSSYAPVIQAVVTDLLQRIELLRSRSDRGRVTDITSELYKFGFEGISSVLFETRLGCLQEEVPDSTLRFIAAANTMLCLSERLLLLPRWSRVLVSTWGRFVQAWDDLYGVAQKLIDRRMAEIEAKVGSGEAVGGLYLTHLLTEGKLSRAEVYTCVTELLLGGVDTTSNTLAWVLYHLSRDVGAQSRLHAEVNSVCPGKQEPTVDHLRRMPYLKAVLKETLRLYPVVSGNGRFVSENEVILDNYWFPKKTQFHLCHYAVSHDEAEFPDAERFMPERWLRAEIPGGQFRSHPYSFIPFGVGVRGCVGKRLAEMEMHFALSRLVQHYQLHPEEGAPIVEPRTRTLLVPGSPINLCFVPRS